MHIFFIFVHTSYTYTHAYAIYTRIHRTCMRHAYMYTIRIYIHVMRMQIYTRIYTRCTHVRTHVRTRNTQKCSRAHAYI